jgi:hypothetical protein
MVLINVMCHDMLKKPPWVKKRRNFAPFNHIFDFPSKNMYRDVGTHIHTSTLIYIKF